jgi:hypothetical protein
MPHYRVVGVEVQLQSVGEFVTTGSAGNFSTELAGNARQQKLAPWPVTVLFAEGRRHGLTDANPEQTYHPCNLNRLSGPGIRHLTALLALEVFLRQAESLAAGAEGQDQSPEQDAEQSALEVASRSCRHMHLERFDA